jgi:hypothetical protein
LLEAGIAPVGSEVTISDIAGVRRSKPARILVHG